MTILSVTTNFTGEIGVSPAIRRISCSDSYATIIASGYLSPLLKQGYIFAEGDFVAINSTSSNASGWYQVSFSNGVPTLSSFELNVSGALTVAGAITSTTGNITSGSSGDAGSFISYPSTASKGTLQLVATDNAGNTATVVTNASMGQATTITIPDPGASTAKTLLDTGTNTMASGSQIILAKANGTEASNAVTASGNAGVITTSALTTAAGSNYAITWTNTKISATSVVALTTQGGTNTMQNYRYKVVPGSGSATLTIYNVDGSAALNGTILIGYMVL